MTREEEDRELQVHAGRSVYEEWQAQFGTDSGRKFTDLPAQVQEQWITLAITGHEAMHDYVEVRRQARK